MADRFGLIRGGSLKGSVVDLRPLSSGNNPLVFVDGAWREPKGELTVGMITDSKPLTAEEAAALTDGSIFFFSYCRNSIFKTARMELIPYRGWDSSPGVRLLSCANFVLIVFPLIALSNIYI